MLVPSNSYKNMLDPELYKLLLWFHTKIQDQGVKARKL